MIERVDELRKRLPDPMDGDMSWLVRRDQMMRNAERLRAEAMKSIVMAIGDTIWTLGRRIANAFEGNRRTQPGDMMHDHSDPATRAST
jgi:hypothetical protein